MLSREDIDFIKATRTEILSGRTEPVELLRKTFTNDPYTNEPVEGVVVEETVQATWQEYSAVATVKDFTVVKGVEFRRDTALVSFDLSVDLTDVKHIKRNGVLFEFLSINEAGLGEINRNEAVVRMVY